MAEKIISLDAETNGLWGQPFSVAFIVYNTEGVELDRATFRCPIEGDVNPWVAENVIPQMGDIALTHSSYEGMLKAIGQWWLSNKEGSSALWHMGHIVETHLYRELHRVGAIGDWDAPYTPIELSVLLESAGYPADSVDGYVAKKGLSLPNFKGGTHNPLYDAAAAASVYFDLRSK